MLTMLDFSCFKLINNELFVLLRKRDKKEEPAFNQFALIGGQIWEQSPEYDSFDLTIEDARNRILKEKAGFTPTFIEQIDAVGSVSRDSRDWSISIPHYCFLNDDVNLDDNFFKWERVLDVVDGKVKLPFDHNTIVEKCYEELKNRLTYSSIILHMLPKEFVVSDLVDTFKSFGLNVSKQTVHARFIKTNIILNTNKKHQNKKGGKPAALFKVNKENISFFERAIG